VTAGTFACDSGHEDLDAKNAGVRRENDLRLKKGDCLIERLFARFPLRFFLRTARFHPLGARFSLARS
jgi:hypothetical protein